jgi:multiple sugar transport system permease protein
MSLRARGIVMKAVYLALASVVVAVVILPLYWMVITAFKPGSEIYVAQPTLWPQEPTLEGFRSLFRRIPFAQQLGNSLVVALSATALATAVSTLAAYALTRLRFRGRNVLAGLFFSAYLVPVAVLFIPVFLLMQTFGLLNTFAGLVLAYQSFTIPFSVWMLRGYFQGIPVELEEAARLDGCNRLQALHRIVLPLAAPGIVASAILSFTLAWNEFLLAVVIMTQQRDTTAPVGLQSFLFADSAHWSELMGGALIMGMPILVLYLLAQRYIVSGLTAGGVRG